MKNYENVGKSKIKVFGIFHDNPPTINKDPKRFVKVRCAEDKFILCAVIEHEDSYRLTEITTGAKIGMIQKKDATTRRKITEWISNCAYTNAKNDLVRTAAFCSLVKDILEKHLRRLQKSNVASEFPEIHRACVKLCERHGCEVLVRL